MEKFRQGVGAEPGRETHIWSILRQNKALHGVNFVRILSAVEYTMSQLTAVCDIVKGCFQWVIGRGGWMKWVKLNKPLGCRWSSVVTGGYRHHHHPLGNIIIILLGDRGKCVWATYGQSLLTLLRTGVELTTCRLHCESDPLIITITSPSTIAIIIMIIVIIIFMLQYY